MRSALWSRRDWLRAAALSSAPVSSLVAAAADPGTLRIRRVEPFVLRIGTRQDITGPRLLENQCARQRVAVQ